MCLLSITSHDHEPRQNLLSLAESYSELLKFINSINVFMTSTCVFVGWGNSNFVFILFKIHQAIEKDFFLHEYFVKSFGNMNNMQLRRKC